MKWTFPNLRLFLALAVVTGGIYPLAVTLVSLILFPHQAHGSLIRNERGEVIASELIAQPFTSARYFWPRPSAGDYATMPSRCQQPLLDLRRTGQDGGGAQGGPAESPQPAPGNACSGRSPVRFWKRLGILHFPGSGGIPGRPRRGGGPQAATGKSKAIGGGTPHSGRHPGGKRNQRDDAERRPGYIAPQLVVYS